MNKCQIRTLGPAYIYTQNTIGNWILERQYFPMDSRFSIKIRTFINNACCLIYTFLLELITRLVISMSMVSVGEAKLAAFYRDIGEIKEMNLRVAHR